MKFTSVPMELDQVETPVDTQVIMDDLRRLEEKIREIAPPKIVIIHPETALTFHDGEIEKSQKYLGMDVVINDLVPPGEILIMNEAEYNKWRDAHMPTEETDEERFRKKKENAWRMYPCRICGTKYMDKLEAKQCARSHEWQNKKGRR